MGGSEEHFFPPSSVSKCEPHKSPVCGFLLGLQFDAKGGGDMFLRNVGLFLNFTVLQPERLHFSVYIYIC